MKPNVSSPPQLQRAQTLYRSGRPWLTVQETARLLDCDQSGLISAARDKNSLGSLEFIWSGNFLKISTMSVIRFLAGGYPPNEILMEVQK